MVFSGYGAGGDPDSGGGRVRFVLDFARGANSPKGYLETTVETPETVSGDFTVPHYIRFVVRDRPGIVASIATVLAKHGVSLDAVLQKPGYPHDHLPFVMTLESCSNEVLHRALEEIARMDFHVEAPLCLPIFE